MVAVLSFAIDAINLKLSMQYIRCKHIKVYNVSVVKYL